MIHPTGTGISPGIIIKLVSQMSSSIGVRQGCTLRCNAAVVFVRVYDPFCIVLDFAAGSPFLGSAAIHYIGPDTGRSIQELVIRGTDSRDPVGIQDFTQGTVVGGGAGVLIRSTGVDA